MTDNDNPAVTATTEGPECPKAQHVRGCQPLAAVAFGKHCDHFYDGGRCHACREQNGS